MDIIGLLDAISTAGFAVALVISIKLVYQWRSLSSSWLLVASFVTFTLVGLSDVLQALHITDLLERWEDYLEILFTPLFLFFVYSFRSEEMLNERLAAEKALRTSQERLRSLVDSSQDSIVLADPERKILDCNPAFLTQFGYKKSEVIGRSVAPLHTTPESFKDYGERVYPIVNQQGSWRGEWEFKRKDGSTVMMEVVLSLVKETDGSVAGYVGVQRDITQRKQVEQDLKNSKARYELLYNQTPVMMHSINSQAKIVSVNDHWLKTMGYQREEVLDRKWTDFLSTDSRRLAEKKVLPRFFREGYVKDVTYQMVKKDGEIIDVLLSASSEKDRRGAFLSSLSVIEDITERKKAEEALRRSEGTLRSIYQAAPIGIGMVSHPEGALSWTNERVSAMTGYSPQELRGMPTHRLYPSQEEHEKAEKILGERVREKGFGSLETRWQRKDGSVIDLLLSSAAIEPSDLSLGMVFTALDISQRKQAEEARRLSEEKFEKAFKASPIWVSITTVEEGRFLEVNDTFSSITGYNRQEALGRTSFELRFWLDPERDRQRVMEEFRRQGYFRNLEVKMRYKDGKVHDMLWSADAIDYEEQPCLINVLTDITEIKRAERALAESEERMRAILEASPNPVVVYDTKGRTTFLNPAFTKVFGWEAVELLGKQVPFIPESEQESTQLRIEEMMTSGKSTTLESKRLTKQGDLLDVFISASCIRNTQEEIIGSVVILTDITQRKNLEAQLRQAQKMEAIGTLAGGIAHDFNNILSAVVGYAELALEDAQEGLPTPEDLKQIISAAQRAKDLTRQILTFSRKAETELRPLNLNQEVEHAAKLLKRTIPRMIEIDLSLTEDLATIRADVNQIEQILMNLGTNAKDAMPDGGRLKIQTENINITGNKRCSACGTAFYGDFVRLRVSDTGYGMEQQILEHIFEPFFTTKKVGEGTGLGLSTVFGIMKSHHGHIICNSAPGKGTTFDLYLPASTGEGSRRDEEKEFSGEVPGGRETLLVVDDEKPIRDLAEKILTRRGYQVLRANSGERALDIYRQQIRDIDLVVLDISMPGMGGYKCLQALLAINPQAKVIIATGYSRNGPLKQILASGAAGYVAKPFRKVELLRKVREVLDHEPKKVQRL